MQTAAKRKGKAGKTALIVDDSAAIRAATRDIFLSDGFKVCAEAENGMTAIDLLVHVKPDIIILDLAMPIMNGLEAAPRLRALLPQVPIILFTLHADQLTNENLSSLGISAIISKGDPLQNLLQKAYELMGD